jgi:hypothetical protein
LCEFVDALGGQGPVNPAMDLEAVIKLVWRCNCRLRLSELRDALGGHNRASLEMHFEAGIQ